MKVMRNNYNLWLKKTAVLLFAMVSSGIIHGTPAIQLENGKSSYDLPPVISFYEDASGESTFEEISRPEFQEKFVLNKKKYPAFGMNHKVYWGKFQLQNISSNNKQWYLVFEYPSQEIVHLYIPQKSGGYKILSHNPDKPFSERYVQNRKVIFPIEATEELQTIYFFIKSDMNKELPMTLVTAEGLARNNYTEMFVSGIYYGIIIIMLLYNLFIFISVRDISYLYYCFFILSFGLVQLSLDGFFYEFISPDHYYFVRDFRVFLSSFSLTGTLLFGYSYLDIKRYMPRLKNVYLGLLPVANLPILLYYTSGFFTAGISVRVLMVVLALMQIGVGAAMMFRNDSAKFYFIAWCVFLTASIFFSLRGAGIYIPYISDYGMQFGNAIEVTILSFGLAHRIRTLQKEKAHIEETFGKVVDPVIRDYLLSGEIEVGGQEKTGTILFGDLRNFTSLSEKYAPKDVVKQLNQFFESMSTEISQRNGLVNKYIGDGILALYNVPMNNPVHCDDAIESAIGMNKSLALLNTEFVKNGVPPLHMGVGIHTGSLLAGNIGSSIRMEYTVIGDNVNIASRIESMTKVYKTPLLVTAEVINSLSNKNKYLIRDIDRLYLKGKSKAISLYEIFNNDDPAKIDKKLQLLDKFREARELYQNREFEAAQMAFEAIHKELPDDNVALLWAKRCYKLKLAPPEDEQWDGVVAVNFK